MVRYDTEFDRMLTYNTAAWFYGKAFRTETMIEFSNRFVSVANTIHLNEH